jgi:hypothetical protein
MPVAIEPLPPPISEPASPPSAAPVMVPTPDSGLAMTTLRTDSTTPMRTTCSCMAWALLYTLPDSRGVAQPARMPEGQGGNGFHDLLLV